MIGKLFIFIVISTLISLIRNENAISVFLDAICIEMHSTSKKIAGVSEDLWKRLEKCSLRALITIVSIDYECEIFISSYHSDFFTFMYCYKILLQMRTFSEGIFSSTNPEPNSLRE